MLCEPCRELFLGLNAVGHSQARQTIHHSSKRSLRLALRQGCILCGVRYSRVRGWNSLKSEATYMRTTGSNYAVLLEMSGSVALGHVSKESTTFKIARIFPRRDRLFIKGYQPTTYTGSGACFSLARHWIQTCCMKHTSCERPRPIEELDWNPTRLIKIDPQSNFLKLCEGDKLPPHVEYAALSHCWGDIKDKIVLTSGNLAVFQKELPDLQCLQTFKHAIFAARHLRFQYIWIDSLCVIQDSEEDWSKEASLMSSVYKYSTLTITATSAEDDTEGCFFNRDIKNCFPTRILVEAGNCNAKKPLTFEVGSLSSCQDWNRDVQGSPVNRRSWVLQERLLSPRLLHYSENQLYWECNEMIASESHPWGISQTANPIRSSARISTLIPPLATSPPHPATQHTLPTLPFNLRGLFRRGLIDTWMDVIELYTSCGLTNLTDKLVAISALAREAYGLQQCRYLAGLWERDLIFELGWMSHMTNFPTLRLKDGLKLPIDSFDGDEDQSTTKVLYRAPSWSWASVDGPVTYPYDDENIGSCNIHPLISDIIPWVRQRTDDLYGQLIDGHLTVSAQVIMVTLTDSSTAGRAERVDRTTRVTVRGYDVVTPGSVCRDHLNGIFRPDSDEVLLMPLLLSFFGADGFFFTALLLEHTEQESVYKRVGGVNWQGDKAALERDPGLGLILSSAGEIQLNGGSCSLFRRDMSRLQKIKIR